MTVGGSLREPEHGRWHEASNLSTEGWNTDADGIYSVWAIKGKNEIIVIDTGCSLSLATQRKLEDFVNPVDILARIGAGKPNVIWSVMLTS